MQIGRRRWIVIIVNVDVPMLGKNMDFQIDENATIAEIREALLDTISQSEQIRVIGRRNEVLIWERGSARLLDINQTGYEAGLVSGSVLLLA